MTSGPADADKFIDQAWIAYRDERLDEAEELARSALRGDRRYGPAWYALGCIRERQGRILSADRCFGRAARAPDTPMAYPCRVDWPRFEQAVRAAWAGLPSKIRRGLEEVDVVLLDHPPAEHVQEQDDIELLGLFVGATRAERLEAEAALSMPPTIYLYRRPHEHAAISLAEFREQVRVTALHELGHYLGFDEDDMEALGLA